MDKITLRSEEYKDIAEDIILGKQFTIVRAFKDLGRYTSGKILKSQHGDVFMVTGSTRCHEPSQHPSYPVIPDSHEYAVYGARSYDVINLVPVDEEDLCCSQRQS